MDKVSVIVTHWAQNYERGVLMRVSLTSLFDASPHAEIIVIDNGGSEEDSAWLLKQNMNGKIALYLRNRKNMHFAYARNQGLRLATGTHIAIADNDLYYKQGWDTACVSWLHRNKGKYLATPLKADPMNRRMVRFVGERDGWELNTRAGSNLFVMRKEDALTIGEFPVHHIAGSHYCNRFITMGYVVAISPEPLAIDMGIRNGYNIKKRIEHLEL